jgi:hypothetical protein
VGSARTKVSSKSVLPVEGKAWSKAFIVQTVVSDSVLCLFNMEPPEGIEPPSPRYGLGIMPLYYGGN